MKILLDENIDVEFSTHFRRVEALHVTALGWAGITNGKLMALASEAGFSAFITADKNLRYQQSMADRSFALIVLDIHPNVIENQIACLNEIELLLPTLMPGAVHVIDGPHPKRS